VASVSTARLHSTWSFFPDRLKALSFAEHAARRRLPEFSPRRIADYYNF